MFHLSYILVVSYLFFLALAEAVQVLRRILDKEEDEIEEENDVQLKFLPAERRFKVNLKEKLYFPALIIK